MKCQDGRRLGSCATRALRQGLVAAAIYVQLCGFTCGQTPGNADAKLSAAESLTQSVEASFRNDASLADLFFIDQANGWSVGDRGVIWHTADGGVTWREQTSGVSSRLNSVFFLDASRGWAAGGESRPYARSTQGVLLQTTDGGATWSAAQNATLPLLSRVKFFDPNVGVAIGAGSAAHPSGVFVTHDGGRDWQPLPADKAGYWLAGDFLDAGAGAVAASAGEFATIARQRVQHSPLAMPSLRSTHAMQLIGPASGWLVGDGGLVMTTADLGHSWQSALGELPHGVAADFNFHALAVHGESAWVAGSPGTESFPFGGRRQELAGVCQRSIRVRFARWRSSMHSRAGPPATWGQSWPRATAANPGSNSEPAALGRRSCAVSHGRRRAARVNCRARRGGRLHRGREPIACGECRRCAQRRRDKRPSARGDDSGWRRGIRDCLALPAAAERSRSYAGRHAGRAEPCERWSGDRADGTSSRADSAHVAAGCGRYAPRASG